MIFKHLSNHFFGPILAVLAFGKKSQMLESFGQRMRFLVASYREVNFIKAGS
jgi:hypothetical protein